LTRSISQLGYRAGLAAFGFAVAYDVVQMLQVLGVLRFPLDEILIYSTSLCIVVPFVLEVIALHHLTPRAEQFWTHAAVVFAGIYAVFVTANYVVQLATVVPAKIRGEAPGLLEQTPHSMFWNFDAIGYIAMGLVSLLAIPVFGRAGLGKWVRWSLIANAAVTPLISLVYFYPHYSTRLLFLGFPWAITAPWFMLMIGLALRTRDPGQPTR